MKVFLSVIALFFVVVGAFVALFLYQGQSVQRYAGAVLSAAQLSAAQGGPAPAGEQPCSAVAPRLTAPRQVAECRVRVSGGGPEVELRLDGGRSFRLPR